MYTFRMRCDEDYNLVLPDGQVHIYLNTHGTNEEEVSEELVELLHYMDDTAKEEKEFTSRRIQKLSRQVDAIRANQEVGIKYMRFRDEFLIERMEMREELKEEVREEVKEEIKEEVREEVKEEIEEKVREEVKEEIKEKVKEEAMEAGRAEGREFQSINLICKKLKKNRTVREIADAVEEEVPFVQKICDIAKRFSPDYDAEKIYAEYSKHTKNMQKTGDI